MPTRRELQAYSKIQRMIVSAAQDELMALWNRIPDTWDLTAVRMALENEFPHLIARYGDAAAEAAAQWFERQIGSSAVLAGPVQDEQLLARARWALGKTIDGTPDKALAALNGIVDVYVRGQGRKTTRASAEATRGVGWARVPSSPKPCAFCLMLASRGAVYKSEKTAIGSYADSYHADCGCVATAMRRGDSYPAGYEPDALYQDYSRAADAAGTRLDTSAILAEMREQLGVS